MDIACTAGAAGPAAAPAATGPAATGPAATWPAATGPAATGPAATGPDGWQGSPVVPERPGRLAVIRIVAVLALLVAVGYLGWRVTSTLGGATLWLAACFLCLEIHAVLSVALHTFDLWDLDAADPPRSAPATLRVAVLIPTYNEPREVLLPTIAAAVALQPEHETWVLDDGDRAWVAKLADRLGARYRARREHEHAKAGNINAVLPELDADLAAIFDADHVANAGFLTRTLPYFADPRVALVQTPQDFYNLGSFEHVERRFGRRFGEQELFYRALAAGRNRWNAAFWCGTNAVIRLAALRDVGGVATDTITEDIHTTIRLHRRGWRTVYHNEVLAQGLAAGTAKQYLSQRLRWGTGAMQVLRTENPAVVGGLTPVQRLSYLSTLLGWFDSWRTLGYLLLPLFTVLSGAVPVAAPLHTFVPWFVAMFGMQRLALRLLARGHATVWHSTLFEIIRLPANLRATFALAGRETRAFAVTAKGRSGQARGRAAAPPLLVALLVGTAAALAWYVATATGATPLHYGVPWIAHGAAAWLVVNAAGLVAAIHRIRAPKYSAERRAGVRFDMTGEAAVDGTPARLRDVSLTGASLLAPAGGMAPGRSVTIELTPRGAVLTLPAVVRTVTPLVSAQPTTGPGRGDPALAQVGVEFQGMPEATASRLALALFRTGITPTVVERDLRRPAEAARAGRPTVPRPPGRVRWTAVSRPSG
jgi:cellulose synthase (UDP-forming)